MSAIWLEPSSAIPQAGRYLRLVDDRPRGRAAAPEVVTVPRWRQVPFEARRRRTLVVLLGLLMAALALPLGGTGGLSHTTGSAQPVPAPGSSIVVRPGDTLWSLAVRSDPNGDPRPLVAKMAAETGSYQVVPGERIVVP